MITLLLVLVILALLVDGTAPQSVNPSAVVRLLLIVVIVILVLRLAGLA
jgi:glycerol uptake facilitator-like aquaporin